jgi:dTDP-4-amino-4,6-dideoxygalactose transaminase
MMISRGSVLLGEKVGRSGHQKAIPFFDEGPMSSKCGGMMNMIGRGT